MFHFTYVSFLRMFYFYVCLFYPVTQKFPQTLSLKELISGLLTYKATRGVNKISYNQINMNKITSNIFAVKCDNALTHAFFVF